MSASSPHTAPVTLLTIPIELRLKIYEDLISFKNPLRRHVPPVAEETPSYEWIFYEGPADLAILRVSKQIHSEALGVLYQAHNGKQNRFVIHHHNICTGIRWTGLSWPLELGNGPADMDRNFSNIEEPEPHSGKCLHRDLPMSCLCICDVGDYLPPYPTPSGLSLLRPNVKELLRHVIDSPPLKMVILKFASIGAFNKAVKYLLTFPATKTTPPVVFQAREMGRLEIEISGTRLRLESNQLIEAWIYGAHEQFTGPDSWPIRSALIEWRKNGREEGKVLKPFVKFVQHSNDGTKSFIKVGNDGLTARTADFTIAIASQFWEQGGKIQPRNYPRKNLNDFAVVDSGKPIEWDFEDEKYGDFPGEDEWF